MENHLKNQHSSIYHPEQFFSPRGINFKGCIYNPGADVFPLENVQKKWNLFRELKLLTMQSDNCY